MAKHLTDKEKKKIAAHWVECQNYSETARKFKVSDYTVKKVVNDDPKTLEKLELKKEENTQDMITYMESKKQKVFGFIDLVFNDIANEEKIKKTPINQLVTAVGILIDKYSNDNHVDDVKRVVIVNDLPEDSKD
ncbi:hypothetical protein LJC02_01845 [Breznakia sp. OttesenSCG-928-G09]|nr:hypothetical protein [Breznakia sp. OttesenSCG-928-G09]